MRVKSVFIDRMQYEKFDETINAGIAGIEADGSKVLETWIYNQTTTAVITFVYDKGDFDMVYKGVKVINK